MSDRRVSSLDGLRALATLLVLSFHYWQQSWLSPCIRLGSLTIDLSIPVIEGAFGMTLLFCISGFGLYWSAEQRPFSLKHYFLKRVARILPTYLLCVIVCALWQVGRMDPGTLRQQLIANLTLTQMTTPAVANNRLNGVLWTVAIEAQFYLVFPLLRMAMKRRPYLTASLALAVGLAWRTWRGVYHYDTDLWYWANQLPGWIDVFVGGMLTAHLLRLLRDTISAEQGRSLAPLMTVLAIAGFVLMYLVMRYCCVNRYDDIPENNTRNELTARMYFTFGACLTILGSAQASAWLQRLLGNRVARFLGAISYQIYLWHMWIALRLKDLRIPDYTTDRPMDDPAWRLPYVLLSLGCTLLVACLLTYLVEKPIHSAITKRLRQERNTEDRP